MPTQPDTSPSGRKTPLRQQLREALVAAMKSRDRLAIAVLRPTLAAIDNAEAVDAHPSEPHRTSSSHFAGASSGVGSSDVPRRVLSDADVAGIVGAQAEERWQMAAQYEKLGQVENGETLRREAAVLSRYLPGTT